MREVRIEDRIVGPGHPVFIVAEIGYNFNTMDEARQSIDAALECGVNAVKFQTFKAETVTSRLVDFPAEAGGSNQFEEFKRYEISEEAHQELFKYARERGLIAFSTPSHYDDVELLERLKVSVYKIGSDDLTNLPFIEHIAAKGKPIIFSTGMGTLAEVAEAYETILKTGNDQIIILYCVSNYPVYDAALMDLRVIQTFAATFPVPIGFSDHTTTMSASLAAVALGASVIERHFAIDKKLDVPDAFFSADPGEMKALAHSIRELEKALGDGIKRPAKSELEMRSDTRKSVIATTSISQGEIITKEMIIVKRPGTGIPPKMAHLVIGRAARQPIGEDEVITWDKLT